jgi:iduronate 2-sulfatase
MKCLKAELVYAMVLTALACLNASAAKQPNVLLICIDDLRPELNCYGKSYIHSPRIDALAAQGRLFNNHYVQAPSCGPSRFTLLTGCYGIPNNYALFKRAKAIRNGAKVNPSMPEWFRNNGYTTVAIGKVSHHPGGMGGKNWNDKNEIEMPDAWDRNLMPVKEWQHPRGAMHGLAHGEIRVVPKDMDVFQSVEGPDTIYPDGLITAEALTQLDDLSCADKPFFLAVGIIRPHLPFGSPAKYMQPYKNLKLPDVPYPNKPSWRSSWHRSGEFRNYNLWGKDPNSDREFAAEVRRHYAACVSYADAQVGRILDKLRETGRYDDTIVVLWGDHGWNLGEHAIWGKHNLFEEALRSPLIIKTPTPIKPGKATRSTVETLDIFPTLCELTGLAKPDFINGKSLVPLLLNPDAPGAPAFSYGQKMRSVRTSNHRMILHADGYAELYDQNVVAEEFRNIADQNPTLVKELTNLINRRLPADKKR